MTLFKMIGAASLAVALATASPAMARGGHMHRWHSGVHSGLGPGIAAAVIASARLSDVEYYGGYTPYGEHYPYYYDAGYVPEPDYGSGQFACQPGTIFRDEYGHRRLCE
jgi:hypothetical protein